MPTLSKCVNEVLLALNGYGAPAERASFLSGSLTASATTINVTNGADFNQGLIEIDNELIYVESVSGNTLTVSADGRGYYGTTAAAHSAGARVTMNPLWPRTRVESVINEAIEGTYPTLYAVGSTSFTASAMQNTYVLPAEAVQVLAVTATTTGPSNEPQVVRRYSVNDGAITLQEGVFPGATVTVSYRTTPTAITTAQDFTASGLRSTAWKAVRLAVTSELLAYMDAQRLSVDTAASAEYAERVPVGSAARISTQLWQRYQLELEQERRRLAAETPVPISLRSR